MLWVTIWPCVCMNTAFSVSLEIYCKLLTGLKFWKISPSFFNRGWTEAHFHWSANIPFCSERLMILVKTGSRVSIQATRRGVGIGSSAHDFLGMASINFRTSCSVSRVKLVIGSIEDTSGCESVLLGDTSADTSSSLPWMVTIFWVKNSPNLLARVALSLKGRYWITRLLPTRFQYLRKYLQHTI